MAVFGRQQQPRTSLGAVLSIAVLATCSASNGYDPGFIGVDIPLPSFGQKDDLDNDVLRNPSSDAFDAATGAWREYIHYSVATNKARRQPICVALNIDQTLLRTAIRSSWRIDPEIGADYQLDNGYYANNEWDRGHMARRSSAAWGLTDAEAQSASDDTMYYSNACLQHENLNQDEWKAVEDWVADLEEDGSDKITVFSGPIYGSPEVPYRFIGNPPAEIPTGFFKVVCFVDENDELATRAFVYLQDDESLRDKQGYARNDITVYQVSTERVEDDTGLIFPEILRSSNPVDGSIVLDGPPAIEDPPVDEAPPPPPIRTPVDAADRASPVFVAAALINPSGGSESGREWISIANYGSDDLDLKGWTLDDQAASRGPLPLSGSLASGETLRLSDLRDVVSGGSVILTNSGGVLTLANADGEPVSVVEWTESRDGEVTIFRAA